jgi:hypothetical protein
LEIKQKKGISQLTGVYIGIMLHIKELIEQDFSGCISVVKDRTVLFEQNYGYSDLANQIKNKLNTKFATASAGKAFVAVAISPLFPRLRSGRQLYLQLRH